MPYNESRPPKGKSKKWVKIWNGAYKGYLKSGRSPDEAERLAFATANKKAGKGKR